MQTGKNTKKNINKNHSRVSLSGIFNACRGRIEIQQQSVADYKFRGWLLYFITACARLRLLNY